jgi:plasmid maintenance system killer protein
MHTAFTASVYCDIFTESVNLIERTPVLEVSFSSSALDKRLGSDKSRRREFGDEVARRLARRLNELHAASTLEAMRSMPGRCHELRENRAGQLAVDVATNLRLVFEPADEPLPAKNDGGLDWSRVRAVRIREVVDYHG